MSTITTFDLTASPARPRSATRRRSRPATVRTRSSPSRARSPSPGAPAAHARRDPGRLDDMYARDMTHSVKHRVLDATGAAYTQACRYPDGTNVLCATVIALYGGVISGQTVIQVWGPRPRRARGSGGSRPSPGRGGRCRRRSSASRARGSRRPRPARTRSPTWRLTRVGPAAARAR